jgi:hypothetical protein
MLTLIMARDREFRPEVFVEVQITGDDGLTRVGAESSIFKQISGTWKENESLDNREVKANSALNFFSLYVSG